MLKGLKYYSMLESSGYGLAALSYLAGLIDLGVAINWRPLVAQGGTYVPWTKADDPEQNVRLILKECLQEHDTIEKLFDSLAPLESHSHVLLHCVPEYWPSLIEKNHINIGYTVWETSCLPEHFPSLINQVDCVLVPSRFSVQTCIKSGIKIPIKAVPHILNNSPLAIPDIKFQLRNKLNLGSADTEKNFVFYTINEWSARKANWTLLHVFLTTFSKEEPVTLVIKTSATGPIDEFDSERHDTKKLVAQAIAQYENPPHVELLNEKLTQQEISALHEIGDCFVSTTHSEGWGLGLFEAAGHANPIIATGWGGQLAFLDSKYANLINYSLVATQDNLGSSYSEDQIWALADKEHASRLFRTVYEDPQEPRAKAQTLAKKMDQNYNSKEVSLALYEAMSKNLIPKQFHFVFGLKQQTEAFHLAYYLCLKSCIETNQPDAIRFHYHYEPHGKYWDLIKPELILHKVALEEFIVDPAAYSGHPEGRFIAHHQFDYAHQADFVRLKALQKYGGVYADMDTLFVRALPDELFQHEFVIGREKDVQLEGSDTSTISLCNALMMAKPGSKFVDRWLHDSYQVFDGTWSKHSCQLAAVIASEMPDKVVILPEHNFYKHACTNDGIQTLFEGLDEDFTEVYSMHMWNHLWWDKNRTDFSHFHGDLITEQYVREGNTTYSSIAKAYLPAACEPDTSADDFLDATAIGDSKLSQALTDNSLSPILNTNWDLAEENEASFIIDRDSKAKFELNQTSKLIISLCDGSLNIENLIDAVSGVFMQEPNAIADDIKVTLQDLAHHEIISITQRN